METFFWLVTQWERLCDKPKECLRGRLWMYNNKNILIWPVYRQEKKRDGCCCCIRLRDDYSEMACGNRDLLQEVMDKYVGRAMLSLPGKVINLFQGHTWLHSSQTDSLRPVYTCTATSCNFNAVWPWHWDFIVWRSVMNKNCKGLACCWPESWWFKTYCFPSHIVFLGIRNLAPHCLSPSCWCINGWGNPSKCWGNPTMD